MPSSCGSVQSARIVYPCFPRPRFELGLSSRVPQVSAKRTRPPRPIKTRAPRSSITTVSTLARQHHLQRHHPAHEPSSCFGSRRFSWTSRVAFVASGSLYRSRSSRRMRGIVHGTIRRMCLHSDNLQFPEVCCCKLCHNVHSSSMTSLC